MMNKEINFDICQIIKDTCPQTKERLQSFCICKKYKKGELIFREREDVHHVYFLSHGYIALFKTNRNQDRKVVFVYGNGEMLNEVILQESVASISCIALTNVELLSFSRKRFLQCMEEDFELTKAVMFSQAVKLRRSYHQLGNTSNAMRLDRQVASKLWKLGRDFGRKKNDKIRINFELSITFLADMVGSKRETVSRIIKKLVEQKLIYVERKYFFILDMDALKEYVMSPFDDKSSE